MSQLGYKSSPTLRKATLDDYCQIAELQRRNSRHVKERQEWSQQWTENPAYQALVPGCPMGWALEVGHQVVGFFGNIPFFYHFQGNVVPAATGQNWVVDAPYRSYSPLLLEAFLAQEKIELMIHTTGARTRALLEAFDYSRVPVGRWDRSSIWITDYSTYVSGWLKRRKLPQILKTPLSVALQLKALPKIGPRQEADVKIASTDHFDDDFTVFAEALRDKNVGRLLNDRSRKVLAWHFISAQADNRLWVVKLLKAARLRAYAIFVKPLHESPTITLVDFQTIDSVNWLFPIIHFAANQCRQSGRYMISTIGMHLMGRDIDDLAPFHRRRPERWSAYYKAKTKTLAAALSYPDVWLTSLYDGDASL